MSLFSNIRTVTNSVSSIHLQEEDPIKYNELINKHFGIDNCKWNNRNWDSIESFLRDYLDNPEIILIGIEWSKDLLVWDFKFCIEDTRERGVIIIGGGDECDEAYIQALKEVFANNEFLLVSPVEGNDFIDRLPELPKLEPITPYLINRIPIDYSGIETLTKKNSQPWYTDFKKKHKKRKY